MFSATLHPKKRGWGEAFGWMYYVTSLAPEAEKSWCPLHMWPSCPIQLVSVGVIQAVTWSWGHAAASWDLSAVTQLATGQRPHLEKPEGFMFLKGWQVSLCFQSQLFEVITCSHRAGWVPTVDFKVSCLELEKCLFFFLSEIIKENV